ncbi:hypothetical protein SLA2020_274320 [Shorea laevis]
MYGVDAAGKSGSVLAVGKIFTGSWELSEKLEREEFELVATITRRIWLRRNGVVFCGELSHPTQVVKCAQESLEEYYAAVQQERHNMGKRTRIVMPRWMAPPCGVIKINLDASIDKARKLMGVGIIARDSMRQVMATMCSFKPYVLNPTVAEAYTALKAAEFGKDFRFQNIILKGVALKIVQALQKEEQVQVWNRYGNLIEDSKTLLNSISSWRAHHVQREANSVAHFLAKEALLQVSENFGLKNILLFFMIL